MLRDGVELNYPRTEEFKLQVEQCRDKVKKSADESLGLSAVRPQQNPRLWPPP